MTLGGRYELVPDDLPELPKLVVGKSSAIPDEPPGLLELRLQAALVSLALKISQEAIGVVERLDPTARNVVLCFLLQLLPAFGPEPRLIGAVGQQRMQLDHAVVTLDDLNLRTGLIEVVTTANLGRRDAPAVYGTPSPTLWDFIGWSGCSDRRLASCR